MQITIKQTRTLSFNPAISLFTARLKMFPSVFDGQSVSAWTLHANNHLIEPLFMDGYGDNVSLLQLRNKCDALSIVATGQVETLDMAGMVKGLANVAPPAIFLRSTPLTEAGDAITKLITDISAENLLAKMHAFREVLHNHLSEETAETHEPLSASRAYQEKIGGGENSAQIMIAAARAIGVPARCVSGYLIIDEDQALDVVPHFWSEVHLEGLGWVGFDPANNVCPTDSYVRICCGFDALSARPLRHSKAHEIEIESSTKLEVSPTQIQSQTQQ